MQELREVELASTVAHMYCRGYSLVDIAKALRLSANQVNAILSGIREMWREAAVSEFSERVQLELKKLDYLETMYWEAWEQSKKAAEEVTTEEEIESEREGIQRRQQRKQMRTPPGDPRFLDGVRWCIERRCQLLGLDAPTKTAVFTAHVDAGPVLDELASSERQKELVSLIRSLTAAKLAEDGIELPEDYTIALPKS